MNSLKGCGCPEACYNNETTVDRCWRSRASDTLTGLVNDLRAEHTKVCNNDRKNITEEMKHVAPRDDFNTDHTHAHTHKKI